jgi:uncharacterized iron-regulated membrane protein
MPAGRARQAWVRAHRWIGLILGVWFVLEGLTGTVLAFDYELDLLLNLALRGTCSRDSAMLSLDRVRDAARPVASAELTRISIPHGGGVARVYTAGPGEPEIAVDRCTGQVLLVRDFGASLVGVTYRIHANLLLGDRGRTIVGLGGILLFGSIVSGFVLWWPRKGGLAKGFEIKSTASRFRRTRDVHKAAGAAGGIVLAAVVLTGTGAAFPETLRAALFVAGGALPASPPVQASPGQTPGLQAAADAAIGAIPDGTLMGVRIPNAGQDAVAVKLRRPGDPMKYSGQTRVLIGADGTIRAIRDTSRLSTTAAVLDWVFPLHTGEALAIPGRVLVCMSGILPLVLFATGWLVWRYKRKARHAVVSRKPRQ